MRVAVRTTGVVILGLIGAVLLALSSTATTIVALAARTTVLIMGGSGDPLTIEKDGPEFIQRYMGKAVTNFISPSSTIPGTGIPLPEGTLDGTYNAVALITPEQFYQPGHPTSELTFDKSVAAGKAILDTCITSAICPHDVGEEAPASDDTFVVFGYSQSATISTLEKRSLAKQNPVDPDHPVGQDPSTSFVLIANGNRPNGGYLARGPQGFTIPISLPGGGVTFSGPTPTNTRYATVDFAIQYEGWADNPVNPLNLLAVANANMGQQLLHPHYIDHSLNDPGIVNQGKYGDTTYYMAPTAILPLLTPLEQIPTIGHALADILDAPLRVLVEAGYDRTRSPGQPTPYNLLYSPNPIALAVNFAIAIPTGLDNGFEDLAGIRPFGTVRPGPYGVGGPKVTYLNPPETEATSQTTEPTNLSLLSSPADSDLAESSQLTSVSNDVTQSVTPPLSTAASTPSPTSPTTVGPNPGAAADQSFDALNNGVPVGGSTTAPSQLASAEVPADASAADPESKKTPDVTLASTPAPQAVDRVAVKLGTTSDGPQRGKGADSSATTSPAPSLTVATQPSQPRHRLPIGSSSPHPKATQPSANAPVSKVPAGSTAGQKATSSHPSDSASSDPGGK